MISGNLKSHKQEIAEVKYVSCGYVLRVLYVFIFERLEKVEFVALNNFEMRLYKILWVLILEDGIV